ncbi:hypothetical protein Ptr902_01230 [Pyrenophora tritici-repentis]|uniref:Uncharacterized protein n=1 Tax=Pyrenophora tritici-repentis TaxID=45151 RepID=A0A5M9LUN7_9PLEO|nr:hypothetical protein PtrV1_01669 [Pyrenophora tritici-repentis]KAF7454401.1 hypothetical protein A1F99_016590 [Pyrenophora tritici-repentis]KAF7577521.1 hypothetical protein PtrM4_017610 [Pyrenophora tritici-repentis]KAI0572972.1 hypothetical protein Alg130_10281 [Pyrenophora tritici-repentis]KAI0576477.1 hypothetical protein Alg215_07475 [Pyrenophora tritici-repentis]
MHLVHLLLPLVSIASAASTDKCSTVRVSQADKCARPEAGVYLAPRLDGYAISNMWGYVCKGIAQGGSIVKPKNPCYPVGDRRYFDVYVKCCPLGGS